MKTQTSGRTLAQLGGEGSDIRVGLDIGDKRSRWSAVDLQSGELLAGWVVTTPEGFRECFAQARHCTVVFEAGTHSRWIYRVLREVGHRSEVLPSDVLRKENGKKRRRNDIKDADDLRELAIDVDRERVKKLWQRPDDYQMDLALMRVRDSLVRMRAMGANVVRGSVKPFGERISPHSVESLPKFARQELSPQMLELVEPVLTEVEGLTNKIEDLNKKVDAYLERRPDSQRMLAVNGIGRITVGVYMAVIADPHRFQHSRDVGAYLGYVPGEDQSGADNPQLPITKAGNELARRVLLQCAHFIMSSRGADCALRRQALAMAGDGKNKIRKRKAAVALARKLATLLHRLWVSGEPYDPMRGIPSESPAKEAA